MHTHPHTSLLWTTIHRCTGCCCCSTFVGSSKCYQNWDEDYRYGTIFISFLSFLMKKTKLYSEIVNFSDLFFISNKEDNPVNQVKSCIRWIIENVVWFPLSLNQMISVISIFHQSPLTDPSLNDSGFSPSNNSTGMQFLLLRVLQEFDMTNSCNVIWLKSQVKSPLQHQDVLMDVFEASDKQIQQNHPTVF